MFGWNVQKGRMEVELCVCVHPMHAFILERF